MTELNKDLSVEQTLSLINSYSFDSGGDNPKELLQSWLDLYHANWIRLATIEALYLGRYKTVSIEQILGVWLRIGSPNPHFTYEFERLICRKLPKHLTGLVESRAETDVSKEDSTANSTAEGGHGRAMQAGDTNESFRFASPTQPPDTPLPSRTFKVGEPVTAKDKDNRLATNSPESIPELAAKLEPLPESDRLRRRAETGYSSSPSDGRRGVQAKGAVSESNSPRGSQAGKGLSPESTSVGGNHLSQRLLRPKRTEPALTVGQFENQSLGDRDLGGDRTNPVNSDLPVKPAVNESSATKSKECSMSLISALRIPYQANWSVELNGEPKPIHQFIPLPDVSSFFNKLKAFAEEKLEGQ